MSKDESAHRNKGPLTPDELALREPAPAKSPMPAEIARFLETPRIYVSSSDNQSIDADRGLLSRVFDEQTWELSAAFGSFVGRPGRSGDGLDLVTLAQTSSDELETSAFRPDWAEMSLQPRLTAVPATKMRRLSGARVRPLAVYDSENRTVFRPSSFPHWCVGRVMSWDDPMQETYSRPGTGVLVGPRVVLTAAHCLPTTSASGQWKVLFEPGSYDGKSIAGRGASSWVSDYRHFGVRTVSAFDMAVMRLYDPLGEALGWLGSRVYDDALEDEAMWSLIGYPLEISNGLRPTIQSGIAVIDDDSDGDALEIEHRADTTAGNSGGPLFSIWPDNLPYVIGTESGDQKVTTVLGITLEDNNVSAGGRALVNLIRWARNEWP